MTEQQPEARAVCEHFYASHCYHGMSISLCMTCHEPDWDDLAGQLSREPETAKLREGARILGSITARLYRTMAAARIEMLQNGPHAGMQWILNSLPDVFDGTEWDGLESAQAWFDRAEAADRAAEASAVPSPSPVSPEPDTAAMDAPEGGWRERAEAAEARLAAIRKRAGEWAALAPADDWGLTPTDTVASDCGRAILAITGTEEENQ